MADSPSMPGDFAYSIPSALLNPKSEARTQILTQLRLLHLLHHRSKNQHRRSIWYRHFNQFRREVATLCNDLAIDLGPGFGKSPKTQQTKLDASRRQSGRIEKGTSSSNSTKPSTPRPDPARASVRLQSWLQPSSATSASLITQAYSSFTSLTTTPSFSPLAFTLLAILARVCSITGLTVHMQRMGEKIKVEEEETNSAEIGEVLERFANEDLGEVVGRFGVEMQPEESIGHADADWDDVGIPLDRESPADAEGDQKKRKRASEDASTKKIKIKRKKKGNSIDDLFADV